MDLLLVGTFAFALFAVYDFLSLRRKSFLAFLLFAAGCALLAWCALWLLWSADLPNLFMRHPICKGVVALSAFCALGLLLYTLFFALPFGGTYVEGENALVIDHGVYALCRHPGVLWLGLFYALLWLLCETRTSLLAWLLFTALDILYVWLQDTVIFPKSIAGYALYQKSTPFLIPTCNSIRRAFGVRSKEVIRHEV